MVQYRRSNSTLPTTTQSRVRAAGPTPHAIPNFRGEMDGINPMAGDMTAAFSKFFGSLNQSAQSVIETNRDIERQREKDINRAAQTEAVAAAQRTYENPNNKGKSATDLLNLSPAQFTYKGETIQTADRRSYSEAFSKTLGSLTGTRAYYQFADEIADNKILPENADAYSAQFWQNNFGEGTGNAYHDAYAQKVWTDNVQNWRHENSKAINKRAVEKLQTATDQNVYQRFNKPDWSQSDYFESLSEVGDAFPHLTVGQRASYVVGKMKEAAVKSPAGAMRMSNWLYERPLDPNTGDDQGQSFAERFPEEAAKLQNDLRKESSEYFTLIGQRKLQDATAKLAAIEAIPAITPADMQKKQLSLLEMGMTIAQLQNTPGTSSKLVAELKQKYVTAATKFKKKQIGVNKLIVATNATTNAAAATTAASSSDSSGTPAERVATNLQKSTIPNGRVTMTPKELEESFTTLYYRFPWQTNSKAAGDLAVRVRKLYTANNGFIGKELVTGVLNGLHSADVNVVTNTISLLGGIDPDRNFFAAAHLKNDPMALIKYQMYMAPGANIQQHHALFNSPEFRAALNAVDFNLIVTDGAEDVEKKDMPKLIETDFYGEGGTGESIAERVMGTDDWWGERPTLDPEVRKYALAIAKVEAAKYATTTGGTIPLNTLKDRVAEALRPVVVPGDNDLISFERDLPAGDGSTDEKGRIKIKYGRAVVNPEGKVEDTVQNVSDAVKEIMGTGIIGLARKDFSTDWDLMTRSVGRLNDSPARMVFDRKTGTPVTLPINQEFETQDVYNNEQRYSRWGALNPFGDAFSNRDVKFTGDVEKDKAIASRFLHPSIALHPIRQIGDKEGPIIGYQMSIMPYYKDLSDKYQDAEALKNLMKSVGPNVKEKIPTPLQRKLLDPSVSETVKLGAMGSM